MFEGMKSLRKRDDVLDEVRKLRREINDMNGKLDILIRLATKGECKLTAHGPVIRLYQTRNPGESETDCCNK